MILKASSKRRPCSVLNACCKDVREALVTSEVFSVTLLGAGLVSRVGMAERRGREGTRP